MKTLWRFFRKSPLYCTCVVVATAGLTTYAHYHQVFLGGAAAVLGMVIAHNGLSAFFEFCEGNSTEFRMRRRLQAPAMEKLLRDEVKGTLCIRIDARDVGIKGGITNTDQVPFCGCWWCRARAVLAEIDGKPPLPVERK